MQDRKVPPLPWLIAVVVLATVWFARPVLADTYISAEPIPSADVVGQDNLAKIESIGYQDLDLWSLHLLNDCQMVQKVEDALKTYGAIRTVNSDKPSAVIATGGHQHISPPSYFL